MKTLLLLGAAAAALCTTPTIAQADFVGTGFYAGVQAGYGFGRDRNTFGTVIDQNPDGLDFAAEAGPYHHNTDGIVLGGQLGFNWEFLPSWVLGLEGEGWWSDVKGAHTVPEDSLPGGDPGTLTRLRSQNRADGAISGRLGFILDESLIYAKAGIDWGAFRYVEQHDDFPTFNSCHPFCTVTFDKTRAGLLLGAGWEFQFAPDWTSKFEYDYINFGPQRVPYPETDNAPGFRSFVVHDNESIVKVGFNYQVPY
jgi:outer membrane immunogenic protein